MGTDNKWKPDERISLGLDARESMENRYEGSPEKNNLIDNSAEFEMMHDWTGKGARDFRSGTE